MACKAGAATLTYVSKKTGPWMSDHHSWSLPAQEGLIDIIAWLYQSPNPEVRVTLLASTQCTLLHTLLHTPTLTSLVGALQPTNQGSSSLLPAPSAHTAAYPAALPPWPALVAHCCCCIFCNTISHCFREPWHPAPKLTIDTPGVGILYFVSKGTPHSPALSSTPLKRSPVPGQSLS